MLEARRGRDAGIDAGRGGGDWQQQEVTAAVKDLLDWAQSGPAVMMARGDRPGFANLVIVDY